MTHASNAFHSSTPLGPSGLNRVPTATKHEQLVKQTQKWVAQTFFGTLLKQARKSPFHSDLFEGGRGGQAFGMLYDQQLAEHMARGTGQKLVNSIVKRIEAKRAYDTSSRKNNSRDAHILAPATQRSGHVPATLRA